MTHTILVVDDEKNLLSALSRALKLEGFDTLTAATAEQGITLVQEQAVDLVLLDVKLPGMDGIAALKIIKTAKPDVPVVMMSGHATVDVAVEATKLGAENFVEKPVSSDRLLLIIRNLLRLRDTLIENRELRQAHSHQWRPLGGSAVMRELSARIDQVAPSQARVLIVGENGTGKEMVAHAIHQRSRRVDRPFVKLNCAAVPAELIESELFGHEKGAFTGAHAQRRGRFELADGGTLLLDEIGDMPLNMQAKVLRVLQEGELERVGGTDTIRVDVRVLAATNKDLEAEIRERRFREDLFYRLNVVTLRVPALRDRLEDIPALCDHFMAEAARRNDLRPKVFAPEALAALARYRFPGNVRELRNIVERFCILAGGTSEVSARDVADALPSSAGATVAPLPAAAAPGSPPPPPPAAAVGTVFQPGAAYSDMVADAERAILKAAIEFHRGHMSATAQALGLERSHLYKKLRALGIR
ncbi:MAG: sigma-54-dependent Fis family transcriptional regulator [Deltaproteobacteria bacterium]|nr:sigma-54-dependent Fis family transcriptional regulator [Deltaproteobacteria bacterium]